MKTKATHALRWALAAVALLAALAAFVLFRQGADLARLPHGVVRPAALADGVYTGAAETLLVKAGVEVTVQGGALCQIRITRHDNGLGGAAEKTVQTMVAENTLAVDAVSGATVSSKVLQSAVYDALTRG